MGRKLWAGNVPPAEKGWEHVCGFLDDHYHLYTRGDSSISPWKDFKVISNVPKEGTANWHYSMHEEGNIYSRGSIQKMYWHDREVYDGLMKLMVIGLASTPGYRHDPAFVPKKPIPQTPARKRASAAYKKRVARKDAPARAARKLAKIETREQKEILRLAGIAERKAARSAAWAQYREEKAAAKVAASLARKAVQPPSKAERAAILKAEKEHAEQTMLAAPAPPGGNTMELYQKLSAARQVYININKEILSSPASPARVNLCIARDKAKDKWKKLDILFDANIRWAEYAVQQKTARAIK